MKPYRYFIAIMDTTSAHLASEKLNYAVAWLGIEDTLNNSVSVYFHGSKISTDQCHDFRASNMKGADNHLEHVACSRVHETNTPWIGDIINHAVHNLSRNWNFNSPRSRKKISMSHHSTRKPWYCVTEAFKTLYVVYFVPSYLMLKITVVTL